MEERLIGKWYSQRSGWQRLQGTMLLEMAAPEPGESVLDVGCGTGELTELLAEAVGPAGKVVGVDLDEGRLHVARQRKKLANIDFRRASGEDACQQTLGAYDLIFANYVIHWMPDRPRFFSSAHRALRPGGRCTVSTIESLPSLFTAFCDLSGAAGQQLLGRLFFVDMETLVQELNESGFEIQQAVKSPQTKQFPSIEAALEYWEATTAGAVRKESIPADALARLDHETHGQATITEQVVRIVAFRPTADSR